MGKSTISMVIFNSYVKLPEGKEVTQISIFRGKKSKFFRDLVIGVG